MTDTDSDDTLDSFLAPETMTHFIGKWYRQK